MSLWIPVTFAAALFQTLRFMLQRQLSLKTLSATGATFARFLYSAPLVAGLCMLFLLSTGQPAPNSSWQFWAYVAAGGAACARKRSRPMSSVTWGSNPRSRRAAEMSK